jgi:hypothetical protein
MRFGVTLANRGVLLGLTTAKQLLALADAVEAAPLLDSVWLGDALFANQRPDAFTLLAALAGRTERALLGTACMGSFVLRDPRVSLTNGHRSMCCRMAARGYRCAPAAARARRGSPRRRRWRSCLATAAAA